MAQSPLGLMFRINADPSQAQSALEGFRGKTTQEMESIRSEFTRVQKGQAEWSNDFLGQSSAVANAFVTLGQASALSFNQLAAGLGKNISMALVYSQSMSDALEKTLKSTTASIAAEGLVQGLRSTALGFYLLAVGDFAGAGSAFESAAIWGGIGAVAAGVGASMPGSMGGRGASGGLARGGYVPASSNTPGNAGVPATALAPGAASPTTARGNLTVAIMGDSDAAHWLANTLNQGVARGVQLTSTRTQRSPYAGG